MWSRLQFKSLRTRLNLAIVSMVLLTVLLVSMTTIAKVASQTEEDYKKVVQQQLVLVDLSTSDYAANIASNTLTLASLPIIKEADSRITSYTDKKSASGLVTMLPYEGSTYEQEVYDLLKAFQESHPSIKNASLGVEENGGFIMHPPKPRFEGYDARERSWYKKAIEQPNQVIISEIYTTSTDEKVILCVKAVMDDAGVLKGVITVDFDLKVLSETINAVRIGDNGYVILVDLYGNVLAHPFENAAIGNSIAQLRLGDVFSNERVTMFEISEQVNTEEFGELWIQVIPSRFTSFPLYYVVVIETSELNRSVLEVLRGIVVPVLLMIALAVILSFYVATRLSQPLVELSQFADSLAEGNLDDRINIQRRDEFGQLAHRFNHMAYSLEVSKARLESLVEQRTSALSKSNTELLFSNSELEKTVALLRETQTQLVRAEKLAGLGTLVAGVAHEINTPLGVAITAGSYALETLKSLLKTFDEGELTKSGLEEGLDKSIEAMELLSKNLERAAHLVIHFKQVAVDQSHTENRPYQIVAYASDIVNSLKPHYAARNHRVIISGDTKLTIFSDPGALAQIITNLVMNAVEHAYEEGQAGTLEIEISWKEERLHIQFSDDGMGISPEILPKIFDPFFTTRRHAGGTGLGLHIVYNIVNLHLHGSIRVESELNKGTRFYIDWPCEQYTIN